jgi:hypothetical protein
MKWRDMLENWGLTSIKLNLKLAEMEFTPNPEDEIAAWEMYVELITRVSTQELPDAYGDEGTALSSIYSVFDITRIILKERGRKCKEFSRISVLILNQVIRPFTVKWHRLSLEGALLNEDKRKEYRDDLKEVQGNLKNYTRILAEIAKVEDLTEISFVKADINKL